MADSPSRHRRIAMGQMLVECGQPARNLARAQRMIELAAEAACEVVVLPECLDLGWTWPGAREDAEPIPGPRSGLLAEAAIRAGIHVVAGLTERAGARTYNAAILLSPRGEILLHHRKINELEIAQPFYDTGQSLAVVETPLGVVGLAICADNFLDSLALGHSLARMGARMILSPCAWAIEASHDHATNPCRTMWPRAYAELARLYDIAVVGVSSVGWLRGGPWDGRKCIGYSLAVGPGGQVLAEGPFGPEAEALVPVEVALRAQGVTGTALASHLRGRGYEGP